MDDAHLSMAARYVELNPVRAKLVNNPEDYRWSSAQAHLKGENDALVTVSPLLERVEMWQEFLERDEKEEDLQAIMSHERTGRPLGNSLFIENLDIKLGRKFSLNKPGPKPKNGKKNNT